MKIHIRWGSRSVCGVKLTYNARSVDIRKADDFNYNCAKCERALPKFLSIVYPGQEVK